MNFKEWLPTLAFALSLTIIINHFMGNGEKIEQVDAVSGQSFLAPELKQAQKPLDVEIIFNENEIEKKVVREKVITDLATYTFSSRGAILESLDILWQNELKRVELLNPNSKTFMLALDKNSPLHYDFVKKTAIDGGKIIAVEYQAQTELGKINKTFLIHKDNYQIDLKIFADFKKSELKDPEHLRLFYPMPMMLDGKVKVPEIKPEYDLKGIANKAGSGKDAVIRDINLSKQINEFVFEPKLFGFEDKFLIQSFISTDGSMPMRAYFKQENSDQYQAILESKPLLKDSEFTWSFYFGPKVESALNLVDPNLAQTVNFGWVTFIAKPMFMALTLLKDKFGDYGIAIIILTILMNFMLLPFKLRAGSKMKAGKANKKKYDQKMEYIHQRYKHDRTALEEAKMDLIKKEGLRGMSLWSILPLFIQMPFFIALNRVLSISFEFYGAPFLWITDLSAKDPLHILPIMIFVLMIITPTPGSGELGIGRYAMALLFGSMTYYFSAGLALYLFIQTVFGSLQVGITQIFGRK